MPTGLDWTVEERCPGRGGVGPFAGYPPRLWEGQLKNSVGCYSRGMKPRGVQGCCGGVCAWILLVLGGCGRAGGAVVLAERGRSRIPAGSP